MEKQEKKYKKICKRSTNPQNTKTQKQTNISTFLKSNIFQGIYYSYFNVPLIWGITAAWIFMYGKISKILH